MLAHEGTHTYPARINIMYMLALNELVPMEQTVHAQLVMYIHSSTQYSDTQHLYVVWQHSAHVNGGLSNTIHVQFT